MFDFLASLYSFFCLPLFITYFFYTFLYMLNGATPGLFENRRSVRIPFGVTPMAVGLKNMGSIWEIAVDGDRVYI